jgi:hypothetical protein
MRARAVNTVEVERVLAELKVARMFTRAFWPQGLITRALVDITNALKGGFMSPREAERTAVIVLEQTAEVDR